MGKMIVLGLDAFHEDLLEHTPFLQELYENNPSGPLTSTTPPVTAPAWASFQTGKNQGKHGVYDFVRYDEDYQMEFLDGKSLRAESFYERLDRTGKDCFLFNLPFSLPARIEGDIVPSWLDSNDTDPVPADLYERFDIRPPQYPNLDGDRIENIEEMRDCFEHNRTQFFSVLQADDHDFLFQLVSITDWVQHNGFRELQREPSSQVAKQTVGMLSTVDEYVKQVYESIEPEDELLILSDHGFKVFEGHLFINDWLQDQGLLKTGGKPLNDKASEERQTVDIGVVGRFIARQEWLYPILRVIKNQYLTKHPRLAVSAA
jgi:predicted AlkP superfamily phosphohydrolase/phosphomutase